MEEPGFSIIAWACIVLNLLSRQVNTGATGFKSVAFFIKMNKLYLIFFICQLDISILHGINIDQTTIPDLNLQSCI